MKPHLFVQMVTASAIALGAISAISQPQPSSAQTTTDTYFCGISNGGVPTTFARSVTGKRLPLIRWFSTMGSEYTPNRRCQEVSGRFQEAYEKGLLNYMTTGIMRGQQVVCASSRYGGSCSHLLFTLKPSQNASDAIQALVDIGAQARGPMIQSEDASPEIYIDMNLLRRDETRAEEEY
jgi:hypothetical protein